jgi:hypothetical protein
MIRCTLRSPSAVCREESTGTTTSCDQRKQKYMLFFLYSTYANAIFFFIEAEYCTGNSPLCPQNSYRPGFFLNQDAVSLSRADFPIFGAAGFVCRPAKTACDIAEVILMKHYRLFLFIFSVSLSHFSFSYIFEKKKTQTCSGNSVNCPLDDVKPNCNPATASPLTLSVYVNVRTLIVSVLFHLSFFSFFFVGWRNQFER